jgi:RNAse (barnase) inhibitor barstar
MAPFRSPDDFDRLDWEILRNGPLCLYHSRDVLAEHVAWFGRHGYVVHAFDCSSWASERDLHEQLGRALHFPDYYGRNLIALEECLRGVGVPDDGGVALVLTAFDAFAKRFPQESWHLLNIIALTCRYVLLTGRRLVALVQSGDEGIEIAEVGGRTPGLNLKEAGRKVRWPPPTC